MELSDVFKKIKSLPIEIKTCRIFTLKVSCGSGEMVSGAPGGEFGFKRQKGSKNDVAVYLRGSCVTLGQIEFARDNKYLIEQ